VQLLASLAAALCLVLVPTSEAAPAPSPQFPADLLVYAAIGKYILGTGVGIGKSSIPTIFFLRKQRRVFYVVVAYWDKNPKNRLNRDASPPPPPPYPFLNPSFLDMEVV
jgi:hypothetical protein